jgi:CheY-like chemotaxis protein
MASMLVIDDEPVIRTLLRTVLDTYGRTIGDMVLPDGMNLNPTKPRTRSRNTSDTLDACERVLLLCI